MRLIGYSRFDVFNGSDDPLSICFAILFLIGKHCYIYTCDIYSSAGTGTVLLTDIAYPLHRMKVCTKVYISYFVPPAHQLILISN
jgi:hypothetical protein